MKIFRDYNKEYLVLDIEEYKTPTSEPEDKLPVHIISN